jgi:uncharacterized protein
MLLLATLGAYILTGCVAGYLAGLFGVGGGIVIVPVLVFMFEWMGMSRDLIMQMSVGTSMAAVTVTAVWSARTHHRNGNVDWAQVRRLMPVVLVGVVAGALIGARVSRNVLAASVVAFELAVSGWFLNEARNAPDQEGTQAPTRKGLRGLPLALLSILFGAVSSLVGIAGGTLFVPLFNFSGMGLRRAIGTAAALGIPVGAVAATVYLLTGMRAGEALPPHSAGYVYLPAFAGCVVGSLSTTKNGADLAKRMNLRALKRAFAIVLLVTAAKMSWSMLMK